MKRKQVWIDSLFLFSLLFIFYLTMFPNVYLGTGIAKGGHNFTPFLMIKEFINGSLFSFIVNNIGNIVLFMPLGFLLPVTFSNMKKLFSVTIFGFCLSFTIETIQWFMENRWSDVDDLLLNTIGTMLGFFLYKWVGKLSERISISL